MSTETLKTETLKTEEAPEETAPGETAPEEVVAEAPKRASRRLLQVLAGLVVVATLCAGWAGVSWYGAATDEGAALAQVRDEALRAGAQAVQNMNTLSHTSVERDLGLWEDSTTAQLYQQIVQGRAKFAAEIAKARTTTTAKILDAALTELDPAAGTARVLVAVQITVIPATGEPAVKKSRLVGELTRTSGGWKLSALSQAPTGPAQ
ncbi:hypothetical protein OIE66_11810 [Nonomuraea sp. NBC_01738]|uniref:hypothetical protein n=1 Tax=Nonomuraea sp. NBC_01738 TaxID=2976003 RepID=UPI002E0D1966|nr:hypothetical protein OIE66_11810 [Nonomuraea sp. NBC_01738]